MPLSNVFRHSIPNPFLGSSARKNSRLGRHGHARSDSAASIVVLAVPPETDNNIKNNSSTDASLLSRTTINNTSPTFPTPTALSTNNVNNNIILNFNNTPNLTKNKGKLRRQESSNSLQSALSVQLLERLDPSSSSSTSTEIIGAVLDIVEGRSRSNDSNSYNSSGGSESESDGIRHRHPISNQSTPTSISSSLPHPSPNNQLSSSSLSPATSLRTSTPIVPLVPLFSSSPEPLRPTDLIFSQYPTTMPTGGSLGKRFGSIFSHNHSSTEEHPESEERINSLAIREGEDVDLENDFEKKKKRLSAGSLSVPIGTFLSNTFRPKHHQQHQQHQQQHQQHKQEQQQGQSTDPLQRKKRKSLLSKLPRLDTRRKITVSAETTGAAAAVLESSGGGRSKKVLSPKKKSKESQQKKQNNITSTAAILEQRDGEESATFSTPGLSSVGLSWPSSPREEENPELFDSVLNQPTFAATTTDNTASGLLSPFYLPIQFRPGSNSNLHQQLGLFSDEQQGLPASLEELKEDWRQYSQVYYDDRWDRASVRTVDSETLRLSADDPNFPGYPERNDYWQQHCRIRERRWKQQLQKHQQQQQMEARSPSVWSCRVREEGENDSILEEDEVDEELSDRLQNATRLLNSLSDGQSDPAIYHPSASTRSRQSTSNSQSRHRQHRVRYTSYSAYMAAMQLKSKNRTDRKRSSNALLAAVDGNEDQQSGASDRLLDGIRALNARSLGQSVQPSSSTTVKSIADRFHGTVMGSTAVSDPDVKGGVAVLPIRGVDYEGRPLPPVAADQHHRANLGTHIGSSNEKDMAVDQACLRVNPPRQARPDSGILFVAATATTADIYPTLNHDPRAPLAKNLRPSIKKDLTQKTSNDAIHAPGFVSEDELMIDCLVASYFDKRILKRVKSQYPNVKLKHPDGDRSFVELLHNDDNDNNDANEDGLVGNGFMMLQSSFGDQGFYKRLNTPHQLSICRVTRRAQRSS
ncbi:hypothetical protein BGZ83_010123 [Gryganskiella cystojenkinii]|nr:hypothetical protein BGZ83_010123 [Gryganskiella cystojenkinii]